MTSRPPVFISRCCDDEANAGKQLTEMMLDLGHDAPRFGLTLRLIAKTLVAHQGLAGGSK